MGKAPKLKTVKASASKKSAGDSTPKPEPRRSGRNSGKPKVYEETSDHVTSQDEKPSPLKTRGRRNVSTSDDLPLKKKKLREKQDRIEDHDDEDLKRPATKEELDKWPGWTEIESEPAYFNSIVSDWGVPSIKIQEVYDLDDRYIAQIPKPMYGLIFLFPYREKDSPEQMVEECPDDVWFSHQIAASSCASVALLNLIMNVPELNIGDKLKDLKERTGKHSSPHERGMTVKNNQFIRRVHNSFAKKSDLFLKVKDLKEPKKPAPPKKPAFLQAESVKPVESEKPAQPEEPAQPKETTEPKASLTGKKRKKDDEDDVVDYVADDASYHFVAFVPINGIFWKLDGLDAQPMNLGRYEDDWWAEVAKSELQARMTAEGGLKVTLLALCASPLATIPLLLAENVAQLLLIESTLDKKFPDWRIYLNNGSPAPSNILGPTLETNLKDEDITRAKSKLQTKECFLPNITKEDRTQMELWNMRATVVMEQNKLRAAYMNETLAAQDSEDQTIQRRGKYPPIPLGSVTKEGHVQSSSESDCGQERSAPNATTIRTPQDAPTAMEAVESSSGGPQNRRSSGDTIRPRNEDPLLPTAEEEVESFSGSPQEASTRNPPPSPSFPSPSHDTRAAGYSSEAESSFNKPKRLHILLQPLDRSLNRHSDSDVDA